MGPISRSHSGTMNGTNLTTDKGHNHSSQRLSVDPAHRGASNATSLTAIGQQMEELWSNRHRSAMGTFIVPLRGNTNETSLTADQGSYHSTQRRPFDPARRDGSNAPSLTEHGRIFGKVAPIFIVPLGSDAFRRFVVERYVSNGVAVGAALRCFK